MLQFSDVGFVFLSFADTLTYHLTAVFISRVPLITADIIVIIVTWAATYKIAAVSRSVLNSNQSTFSGLLLRDGTLYFAWVIRLRCDFIIVHNVYLSRVMLSLNVLDVAFSSSPVSMASYWATHQNWFTCFTGRCSVLFLMDLVLYLILLNRGPFQSCGFLRLRHWYKPYQVVIYPHLTLHDESPRGEAMHIRVNRGDPERIPGAVWPSSWFYWRNVGVEDHWEYRRC